MLAGDVAWAQASEPLDASDKQKSVATDAQAENEAGSSKLAKPSASKEKEESWTSKVRLRGFLRPGFGLRFRPGARPVDVFDYGFFGHAQIGVVAKPFRWWHAVASMRFSTAALTAVTDVNFFDPDGDGAPDGLTYATKTVPGVDLQRAVVRFVPSKMFSVDLGALRIPFSLSAQSSNAALMFPTRAAPNEIFLSGPDLGLSANLNVADGVFLASLGVFNGDSLGLALQNTTARGAVFAGRVDVNPFGSFPFGQGDQRRGPFRLGVGAGTILRPVTLFDDRSGTEPRSALDFRLSASLRMAFRGLYVSAEYFRRQQTDDFSSRTELADGAYAQVAYFFPTVDWLAFEPIVRAGFVAEDQTFEPRLTGYTQAGFSVYPRATASDPAQIKVSFLYLGERRFSEDEDAHGFVSAATLRF